MLEHMYTIMCIGQGVGKCYVTACSWLKHDVVHASVLSDWKLEL